MTMIRNMPELVEALRARRDELNISHETIDAISGVQPGYTSKILAGIKNLGPMSFGALLGALGLAVVVVEDPQAAARVRHLWQPRKRPVSPGKAGALIINRSDQMLMSTNGDVDVAEAVTEPPTQN
ncbi:hypothetical protein [Bradyrhizobium sp. SBR1B]|uniref:hypothetical protein n=1 Tax=Bradyrhizobium sp. SBR1B TaxID=2663836 RepID=UPI0016057245|nr:hypothetical protein [Bradyrhizobium sp. SBR1B]MBB4378228.1 hypothetical protein [Bradyrhizobium sp. SBR1B]